MKIHKNNAIGITSSPNDNSCIISDADSFYKSQQVKRRQSFESNASLVLLPANSPYQKFKKKSKVESTSSDWIVSPIPIKVKDEEEFDLSPSHSDDESSYFLEEASAIYAKNIYDSVNSSSEDESKCYTQKSFEELIEKADRGSDTDSSDSGDNFYVKKKHELSRRLRNEPPKKKRKTVKKTDKIELYSLFSRNTMILLMDHPAAATIYRYVSVEVLLGSVSVNGHERNTKSSPLKVFSSCATGLIELKTESCDALWKNKNSLRSIRNKLQNVTGSVIKANKIIENLTNSTVVVVLVGHVLTPRLQFLELYYPNVFKMNKDLPQQFKDVKHPKSTYVLPIRDATIQFNAEAEDLASDVLAAIRSSQLKEKAGPRILIYGPKNTGKSSLLRYLMNKSLSMFPAVFFLDADPGQTEFTPPGVVSLTEVTKPVIGPPFSHQKKPIVMSFTGAISAESSPDMYSKSVARIACKFQEKYSHETLFVNTMGWIKGIGLECLKNVMLAVRPTILIEIIAEDENMFDYREILTNKRTKYYQICKPFSGCPLPVICARDQRYLSLLSYFGKSQLPHEKPMYLNSFRPVCISWDSIPIYIFGKKVPPYSIIQSIIGSFIALCKVDESLILESSIPSLPKTLEEEPENDCKGFGIVRAVDETKHLLYIITPLTLEELKSVNAIIKGNIMVPPAVFLEQPILGVPLPFTDERIYEKEAENQNKETENLDKIAKIYNKGIAKRYARKKQHK